MKIRTLLFCLIVSCTGTIGRADISVEKRQEIDLMLRLVGMEALANQMLQQMIASFRTDMKEVPSEYWDSFSSKFSASELLEKIAPLYDKYYSLEDLRAVNAFYSSPTGQRILKTLPQIMQESMAIGEQWGREIGQRVAADMSAAQAELEKE